MKATVYVPDNEMQGFLNKLKTAEVATIKKAGVELLDASLNIDKNAKEFVPVKDGLLKGSIRRVTLTQDNLNHSISANTEYATFVEKGTSKQRPQPYLRPAYLIGVNRFYAKMRTLIK